ncbi:MAG: hypothetical protein QOI81_968, partial [Actinomycetota bacterium]|nr:hypothetical protein [Actinomycetota bacterium]
MRTRPLESLPTIRAKLGSTIVFAVGMTVLLVVLMLGYALRESSHDSDRLHLLSVARRAAAGLITGPPQGDITFVTTLPDGTVVGGVKPPDFPHFSDDMVHIGISGSIEYASAPVVVDGKVDHVVYALQPAPSQGFFGKVATTFRFLGKFWWQFLLTGTVASFVALLMARLLARGMTQPLRDMADAAT